MDLQSVQIIIPKENPLISVIIPSLDGFRGRNVPKLLEELRRQSRQAAFYQVK